MIKVIGDKEVFETIYYDYLNNNKNSMLEIFLDLSPELDSRLTDFEPVFKKRMNNKNILAILTELLYNRENDFVVSDLDISKWDKETIINITLKYKNKDDLFIAERKILLNMFLGINFED